MMGLPVKQQLEVLLEMIRDAGRGFFLMNLDIGSVFGAELWGVYQGLLLAWELEYKQVVVEIDNESVAHVI